MVKIVQKTSFTIPRNLNKVLLIHLYKKLPEHRLINVSYFQNSYLKVMKYQIFKYSITISTKL